MTFFYSDIYKAKEFFLFDFIYLFLFIIIFFLKVSITLRFSEHLVNIRDGFW